MVIFERGYCIMDLDQMFAFLQEDLYPFHTAGGILASSAVDLQSPELGQGELRVVQRAPAVKSCGGSGCSTFESTALLDPCVCFLSLTTLLKSVPIYHAKLDRRPNAGGIQRLHHCCGLSGKFISASTGQSFPALDKLMWRQLESDHLSFASLPRRHSVCTWNQDEPRTNDSTSLRWGSGISFSSCRRRCSASMQHSLSWQVKARKRGQSDCTAIYMHLLGWLRLFAHG
ncbi:hypothetical protein EJ04DRAFT_87001 [Polyplosphaeria fusca]|uniref:Uncharacterized protein n=1 Tax=Polyplosphaeria fusca TaxID=682080 RepID=A0A9P4R6M7_9PLEO|nr:hypothetical protein EJ04DRAFT_87001 [Polyplosphaeria fusca]